MRYTNGLHNGQPKYQNQWAKYVNMWRTCNKLKGTKFGWENYRLFISSLELDK
jgi:hypothetical protein